MRGAASQPASTSSKAASGRARSVRPAASSKGPSQGPRAFPRRALAQAGGALALALAGGAAVAAAASAMGIPGNPLQQKQDEVASKALVRAGMIKFERGFVEESVRDYDQALALRPGLGPYLWQRGLSLYYLGEFALGAIQFRQDVAVNPNDTEEAIWAYLCEAREVGTEAARAQFLSVGRDPRPVMRAAEAAFRLGDGVDGILAAAGPDSQGHDAFYSRFYAGLYHEAEGEEDAARGYLLQAVGTEYGARSGDFMASLAKVHCLRRGWSSA